MILNSGISTIISGLIHRNALKIPSLKRSGHLSAGKQEVKEKAKKQKAGIITTATKKQKDIEW